MITVDPSRGDHSWNDRSDDERRDITDWAFSQSAKTLEKVAPEMLVDRGPTYGGAVAKGGVAASPGAAGAGPGGPGVAPEGAGTGPGRPGTGWLGQLVWVRANNTIGVEAHQVHVSDLPMLQPVLEPTNTALVIGGRPFVPHPGTSNAAEIEDLMGDGDNPMEAAWWMKQAANLTHIDHNVKLWANDPATQQWAKEFDEWITPW